MLYVEIIGYWYISRWFLKYKKKSKPKPEFERDIGPKISFLIHLPKRRQRWIIVHREMYIYCASILDRPETACRYSGIKCVLMLYYSAIVYVLQSLLLHVADVWTSIWFCYIIPTFHVNLCMLFFVYVVIWIVSSAVTCIYVCFTSVHSTNELQDLKWCFIFIVSEQSELKVRNVNHENYEFNCSWLKLSYF